MLLLLSVMAFSKCKTNLVSLFTHVESVALYLNHLMNYLSVFIAPKKKHVKVNAVHTKRLLSYLWIFSVPLG